MTRFKGETSYIRQLLSGKSVIAFMLLVFLIIVLFIVDILSGPVSLTVKEVIKSLFTESKTMAQTIVLDFRLPKAITALLTGVALSVSGLQMQTLFRNPLAGPYVLGVSSGSSLGVALILLGTSGGAALTSLGLSGSWLIAVSAWIGAGVVMLLIVFISSRVKNIMTILIIGIMLGSGISAIVTILQYFSNETMLKAYVIWTMGSLGNLSESQLNVLAISVFIGTICAILTVKMLNALQLGEVYARSMGLNLKITRNLILTSTSILAGSVTAFCGPIGFIGIAVPHIARYLFRTSDHKVLMPASMLIGSSVMLLSDIISQLPSGGSSLPINSITALIGIPVVLWVIISSRTRTEIF